MPKLPSTPQLLRALRAAIRPAGDSRTASDRRRLLSGAPDSWDRMPASVQIVDVAPRDGLQNEQVAVGTAAKLELVARLRAAGVRRIEAAAFVSPKAVPQMADAAEVLKGLMGNNNDSTRYAALVPNLKGLEGAAKAGVHEVTVLAAATETMSRKNTNCSLAEALDRASAVVAAARAEGLKTRGAIAVSMHCPYEGEVPIHSLIPIMERMHADGCDEIFICDTIGKATPGQTRRVLRAAAAAGLPAEKLGLHLHDTYGQALANIAVGLQEGVSIIDASVGGLGGCPFAGPGASGNLSTEDLVYMLHGMGIETGIELQPLAEAGQWICGLLGRSTGSRAGAALLVNAQSGQSRVAPSVAARSGESKGAQATNNSSPPAGTEMSLEGAQRGPLTGYRVVELGNFIAGPFCATNLAYFGADVVKVETPGKGDPIRYWRSLASDGQSPWSRSLLRNKRSITINTRHAEGVRIVRALLKDADVLVENFRPGVLEKLGLGPDSLHQLNPGLVIARISGYGQTGPYSPRPGFASATEGEGGFRYVNGFPGQAPVRPNLSLGDSLAGVQAAFGVAMALLHREKTGKGQVVDMALYEAVYNMMEGLIPDYTCLGHIRQPSGTTVSGIVPTNTHACKDGKYVIIGANSDEIFARVMRIMDREDMASDTRFADNKGRVEHQDYIYKTIDGWCASLTQIEVLEKLGQAGCPAGPIYDAADMLEDPHYHARGMFEDIETPTGLKFKIPAMVPKLSETPGRTEWCGPQVGAHNREVLGGYLGMSSEEICKLQDLGVVGKECG